MIHRSVEYLEYRKKQMKIDEDNNKKSFEKRKEELKEKLAKK